MIYIFSIRFYVDSLEQAIFLKQCNGNCSLDNNETIYLSLVCRDNNGTGNACYTTVVLGFQNNNQSCFTLPVSNFYLLSTGSSGTDIPNLKIKVFLYCVKIRIYFMCYLTFVIQGGQFRYFECCYL